MSGKPTRVIFRVDPSYKNEVVAVFPDDKQRGDATCYAHVGQHAACSRGWYEKTRPATPAEYQALKQELESIYTDGLAVVSKMKWRSSR